MAESTVTSHCEVRTIYSQHFQHPDPLAREAISRTTRYRVLKKRKLTESLPNTPIAEEVISSDCLDTHDVDIFSAGENSDAEIQERCTLPLNSHETSEHDCIDDIHFINDPLNDLLPEEIQVENQGSEEETDTTSSQLTAAGPSIAQSSVLIMQYSLRHNLTQEAIADLLKLLKICSPRASDAIPPSLYLLKKQFHQVACPPKLHYFCSECLQGLSSPDSSCSMLCGRNLSSVGAVSSFIELSLCSQLVQLLQRNVCWEAICHQYSLRQGSAGSFQDIYDGAVYQELVTSGFLANMYNISFVMNTDGIPVFRSSSFSFWPVWLLINELPYQMRIAKENKLLAGLWYGISKPDMTLFLKPTADTLSEIFKNGVKVSLSDKEVTVRAVLIACTCDLPARALVLNTVQYNGFYGCSHCLQKGCTLTTARKGRVHTFPFSVDCPSGPERTNKQHLEHVEDALKNNSAVMGVKGPSWLSTIPHFDIVKGTSVDYMHCVLLGVTRLLLKLWFNSSYHGELWYLGNCTKKIDALLTAIKPPDEIKRTPRSIENSLKFWKAHELKAWLLHYSPVVLYKILPDDFYQHHLLLVESTYLLLQDVVREVDIAASTKLLHHYCYLFSDFYGERYMTLNVHGLLHLPDIVKNLGPLWAHSCFPFESANGDLLKLFHGSKSVEKQVVQHIETLQAMPSLVNSLPDDTSQKEFCRQLSSKGSHSRDCTKLTDKICVHGKSICLTSLSIEDLSLLASSQEQIPSAYSSISQYSRLHLITSNRIITSNSAYRGYLRDNSGVVYSKHGLCHYGRLDTVFVFEVNQHFLGYVVIQTLTTTHDKICNDPLTNSGLNSHILSLKISREKDVVSLDSIIDKIVLMDLSSLNGCLYASRFPNSKEPE